MIKFKLIRRDGILSGAKLENLKHFQKRQQFTDLVFICQDNLYHAHKLVLSSVSNTARKDLLSLDSSRSTVFMTNTHPHDVENIICFMYAGQVWLPLVEVDGFLKAAKILRIDCFEPSDDFDVPEELLYKPKPRLLQDSSLNISNNIDSCSRVSSNNSRTFTLDAIGQNAPNISISDQENSFASTSKSSRYNSNSSTSITSTMTCLDHDNDNNYYKPEHSLPGQQLGLNVNMSPSVQNRIESRDNGNRNLRPAQVPQVTITSLGTNQGILIRSQSQNSGLITNSKDQSKPGQNYSSKLKSKARPRPEKFRRLAFDSMETMDADVNLQFDENAGGARAARLDTSYVLTSKNHIYGDVCDGDNGEQSSSTNSVQSSTPCYVVGSRKEFVTKRVGLRGIEVQGRFRDQQFQSRVSTRASSTSRHSSVATENQIRNPVFTIGSELDVSEIPILRNKKSKNRNSDIDPLARTPAAKNRIIKISPSASTANKKFSPTVDDIVSNIDCLPARINTILVPADVDNGNDTYKNVSEQGSIRTRTSMEANTEGDNELEAAESNFKFKTLKQRALSIKRQITDQSKSKDNKGSRTCSTNSKPSCDVDVSKTLAPLHATPERRFRSSRAAKVNALSAIKKLATIKRKGSESTKTAKVNNIYKLDQRSGTLGRNITRSNRKTMVNT